MSEELELASGTVRGPDGQLYQLRVTAEAEVVPGPDPGDGQDHGQEDGQ